MAEALGFWKFINTTSEDKRMNKKKLLEDIFEGFVGAIENVYQRRMKLKMLDIQLVIDLLLK